MDTAIFEQIEQDFTAYAQSFFTDDDFINSNLHLKLCHSYKVCQESTFIAQELNLPSDQLILARLIGLLHDIGRFPQFKKYKTYKDIDSINHGLLGVQELQRTAMLSDIPEDYQNVIIEAIKFHGAKDIPASFDGSLLLQTQLIRDADKLDIFRIVMGAYKLYQENPEKYPYEVEYPENGKYSPEILEAVMQAKTIDYKDIKTMNDARLLQLAWIFDINFNPALQRIREKGYVQTLLDYLPDDAEIEKLSNFIQVYIDKRLNP